MDSNKGHASERTGLRRFLPKKKVLWVVCAAVLMLIPMSCSSGGARSDPSGASMDWPYYGNDIGGMRYQNINQINTNNVKNLRPAWVFHTGVTNSPLLSFESQPIIVNHTLFVTSGEDHVFALNPVTGDIKWTYNPNLPKLADMAICCGVDNRGVAVGGGKVFIGQLDANLVALDQNTGKVVWKTAVEDYHKGFTITMAPQYIDGKVLVGVSGGEFETRGSLSAYDANSGKLLWRFYTIPGPGQPGNNTWANISWKTGGAPVWDTPVYDPKLHLVYFSTGNAGPDLNGSLRAGKNLYAASVVALDVNTGQLAWYFQEVHHDIWDYDGPQMAQLFTVDKGGQHIPAIGHANKDGWYFILDRRTGKPIYPVTEKPVPTSPSWQNPWPTQPESTISLEPHSVSKAPSGMKAAPIFTPPGPTPLMIQPGFETGPEWPAGAYSPRTHYVYVPSGGYEPWAFQASQTMNGTMGSAGRGIKTNKISSYGLWTAVDTTTGKVAWQIKTPFKALSGMVVAGDLVFFGQSNGQFDAIDARSGKLLWSYMANMSGMGAPNGSPAVYEENGVEYVVMAFGGNHRQRADYASAISPLGDALVAFALPQMLSSSSSSPHVVKASPKLVDTGAPETYPTVDKPSPNAKVIELAIDQRQFTPDTISVSAGQLIAFHITNKGVDPVNIAFELPTGPVGPISDLAPGKSEYFQLYAPSKPGTYKFFGPGDLKFQGLQGALKVTASRSSSLTPTVCSGNCP